MYCSTRVCAKQTKNYRLTFKRFAVALLHILGILAGNLLVTLLGSTHSALQVGGVVHLHSLIQEEEEAETAQRPEEGASRADRLHIEIDGRFGSNSILPNQLGVLRQLIVSSFLSTLPTDFEGSFLCTKGGGGVPAWPWECLFTTLFTEPLRTTLEALRVA